MWKKNIQCYSAKGNSVYEAGTGKTHRTSASIIHSYYKLWAFKVNKCRKQHPAVRYLRNIHSKIRTCIFKRVWFQNFFFVTHVFCSLVWWMSVVLLNKQWYQQPSYSCRLQSSAAEVSRGTLYKFKTTKCHAGGKLLQRKEKGVGGSEKGSTMLKPQQCRKVKS